MYLNLVLAALGNMLYLALHVSCSGSFPKPLTAREERECLERIRSGDSQAKSTLIEHNLRLVAHIVKKYYAASGEQDDLISIGTIGLIKAASTFNYEKGTRFATYASKCIENEILMAFRAKKKSASDISISDPIDCDRDGNALTLMDIMADEEDIVSRIDLENKTAQLRQYIASALTGREREIVELRYGLGRGLPLTQREVAQRLHISRSYV